MGVCCLAVLLVGKSFLGMSDRLGIEIAKGLMIYGLLAIWLVWVIPRTISAYRDGEGWTSFLPFSSVVFLIIGVWAWVGFFGDHGWFVTWPIIVFGVYFAAWMVRRRVVHRIEAERAEELRVFPAPPQTGGPASKSDFKDWL